MRWSPHIITMHWMLPNIPPSGKRVEVTLPMAVQFDGAK